MSELVKYGISMDYIPNWGFKEAYREVLQNFMDYGDYSSKDIGNAIVLENNYAPTSLEFLKVGFSQKTNPNAIGKHGEGIKMAMLVLHRLGIKCAISSSRIGVTIIPVSYEDPILGENCFGLEICNHGVPNDNSEVENKFAFQFMKTKDYDDLGEDHLLTKEDIIFKGSQGSIVKKEVGRIYVGGLFVSKMDGLSHAYDLNPSCVNLGRDRNFPSTFDIEWHCSKIVQEYNNTSITDVSIDDVNFDNRDFNYTDYIPDSIAKSIDPIIDESTNEVVYNYGSKVVPYKLHKALETNHIIKEKIKQVRVVLVQKMSPYQIIADFYDRYGCNMSSIAKAEFQHIKALSMSWELKEKFL